LTADQIANILIIDGLKHYYDLTVLLYTLIQVV